MFSDRLIFLPKILTVFCAIEKNGLVIQNKMARQVQNNPHPERKHVPFGLRFTATQFGYNSAVVQDIMTNRSWRRYVVLRNPITRFVSAFNSKCKNTDGDGNRHCWSLFGKNATFDSVISQLLHKKSNNPHWASQHSFCGGITRYNYTYLDFEKMAILPVLLHQPNLRHFVDNKTSRHVTNASSQQLSNIQQTQLRKIYAKDFNLFQTIADRVSIAS
tara:strand:- start:34 stop:684 length:651 start_codon:yes stop_codon:yes gene_type:complete